MTPRINPRTDGRATQVNSNPYTTGLGWLGANKPGIGASNDLIEGAEVFNTSFRKNQSMGAFPTKSHRLTPNERARIRTGGKVALLMSKPHDQSS